MLHTPASFLRSTTFLLFSNKLHLLIVVREAAFARDENEDPPAAVGHACRAAAEALLDVRLWMGEAPGLGRPPSAQVRSLLR